MWPHWKILQDTVQTNYTGLPITLIVRNESVRDGSFFDIVVSLINLIILYFEQTLQGGILLNARISGWKSFIFHKKTLLHILREMIA